MATVRFELRGNNPALRMIYLVVSQGYQRDRVSTGIKIEPKNWNSTTEKVKKSPNSNAINQKIASLRYFAENLIFQTSLSNPPVTFEKLKPALDAEFRTKTEPQVKGAKGKLKTAIPTDLLAFTAYFIDQREKDVSVTGKKMAKGTIKAYKTTYAHLKRYCKAQQADSSFSKIDTRFITGYRTYLTLEANMKMNTVAKLIRILKTILNEATELGANTNTAFRTYKSMKVITEDIDNVYLTETELGQLFALDLSEDWRLQNVRDWFVIACEMGIRYSDWSNIDLAKIDNNRIEIVQHKTGDRAIIPLGITQYFWQIIKRRDGKLPRIYTNQECNRSIKTIAKLAEITAIQTISYTKAGKQTTERVEKYTMISTHTARRTFATNMFLKNMPISLIMSITGHKTEKAFLLYVKAGINEKADMVEKYLENLK